MKDRQGIVMVYTGNGKGKTTSALGLALRASGHDEKIFMVQFRKSDPTYGEIQAIRKFLPNMTVLQSARSRFRKRGDFEEADYADAQNVFNKGKEALLSGEYDLVIFDEINFALYNDLLQLDDVLNMLKERPRHVNVVLTGRYACDEIIAAADLVSEVKEIKHHYQAGVKAQPGVEY
ncbi:MAG TPA: cob(I)yrinic acid a,c-diamide adenosyltransferase [Firmicutes bacterium]|jgi:cob(I)alamin adenosyltransferase|nr:cob(I)yrinic acid a,c-diamide adenosyltransferase [Bacillota bacterium]HAA37916.1 cob(I)yrinic acid a,c-diamide adenosyltransferase [Bacillota bacterium]